MLQDGSRIAYLSDQLTIWGPRILVAILILIVTHFVARLVRLGLIKLVDKIPLLTKASSESDSVLAGSMGTLGYWVIWLLCLWVALQPLGMILVNATIVC